MLEEKKDVGKKYEAEELYRELEVSRPSPPPNISSTGPL
jgi:hypothetical protein